MERRQRLLRVFGLALIVIALLLAVYMTVAYLGYQSGQELQATRAEQTRTAAIMTQVDRAREEIDEGNHRLAVRRLEWVLEREPENAAALELMALAQANSQTPTPTGVTATPELTPTAEATAGTPQADQIQAARELRRLIALVESEEWDDAIQGFLAFQNSYPEYERRRTDELLQQAYIGLGVEELYGEQVELGMYYLGLADALGNLPQEVRDQMLWAELYLGGMAYYGVNWDVSLFYFRQLCPAAPFYQDACQTLFNILAQAGDGFAARQDWCPAESYYQEAASVPGAESISQKLGQARQGCADATPTPSLPVTDTLPLTGTLPLETPGVVTDTAPIETPENSE
jgi:hypothetical protein